ncbi:hypothetical protein ACFSJY_16520 [Thalassotalea euphylliae]|uniref:hypothetical protein n=1 Tax=Thalassotalea euphylliae TaxID=1655234 RepID=UPI003641E8A4
MTAPDKQVLLFVCAGIMIWSLLISFLIAGFQTILSPPDSTASFWVRFTYKLRYGVQIVLSGLFIIAVIATVIMTVRLFNFSSVA